MILASVHGAHLCLASTAPQMSVMTVGEGDTVTVSIKCLEFCLHKYYKLKKSKIILKKTENPEVSIFKSYIENWLKIFHEDLKKHKKWSSKKLLECSFILKLFSTLQVQNTKNFMKSNYYKILHFYTQLYYYQHIYKKQAWDFLQ